MTDPRIHERRVLVARALGRRRRRLAVAGLVLVLVLVLGFALVHTSLFGAEDVEISGSAHASRAAVISAAGLAGSPPLVDLSAAVISSRLERLPWVAHADVSLSFPTTVRIRLYERTPVAVVVEGAHRFALLDPSGRVLAREASRPAGLPVVATSPVPPVGGFLPKRAAELALVAAATPEEMVHEVTRIAWAKGSITLVLPGSVEATLGDDSELPAKFEALATVIARVGLSGVREVELQVPSSPVLIH